MSCEAQLGAFCSWKSRSIFSAVEQNVANERSWFVATVVTEIMVEELFISLCGKVMMNCLSKNYWKKKTLKNGVINVCVVTGNCQ